MSGSSISTSPEETLLSKAFPFNLGCHSCWIMPWNCTVGNNLARYSPLQGGKQDAGCLAQSLKAAVRPLCLPCAHPGEGLLLTSPSRICCGWGRCDRQIPSAPALPDAWHVSVAKQGEVLTC